ncbi:TIGR04222 domain-containing membrane protein [Pseudonocardia sp. GCM10023141]|uniref:TIGR04222 domain-containing membrane protein n=1 Tax=Pseudonocardia sp. GCM10023141 TaxID=3252653 RepID=UPI003611B53A
MTGAAVAFGAIGIALLVVLALLRRDRRDPAQVAALRELVDRPEHLAYLAGGPTRALFTAIAALDVQALITTTGGTVRATGAVNSSAPVLERAVHRSTRLPVQRTALPVLAPVAAALGEIRDRLEHDRLLLPGGRRDTVRALALLLLALAVGGAVWAGLRAIDGHADLPLIGTCLVLGVLAIWQLRTVPIISGSAARGLDRLRRANHGLHPRNRPDWNVYGADGATLSVALFGIDAMWASEPTLAGELGLWRRQSLDATRSDWGCNCGSTVCGAGSAGGGHHAGIGSGLFGGWGGDGGTHHHGSTHHHGGGHHDAGGHHGGGSSCGGGCGGGGGGGD